MGWYRYQGAISRFRNGAYQITTPFLVLKGWWTDYCHIICNDPLSLSLSLCSFNDLIIMIPSYYHYHLIRWWEQSRNLHSSQPVIREPQHTSKHGPYYHSELYLWSSAKLSTATRTDRQSQTRTRARRCMIAGKNWTFVIDLIIFRHCYGLWQIQLVWESSGAN